MMPELYCPCCLSSSNEWEHAYWSRKYHAIVGCDACCSSDPEEEKEVCPVCGETEQLFRDKITKEVIGCYKCLEFDDYDDCIQFHEGEMI